MRDLREELEKARNQIRKLDAEFTEETKKEFALLKEGMRRREEDGKGWEELLKSMPVDLSKLLEHDKADERRASPQNDPERNGASNPGTSQMGWALKRRARRSCRWSNTVFY
jgi:hypothetical protein